MTIKELLCEIATASFKKWASCTSLREKVSVLTSKMDDLSSQKHDLEIKLSAAEKPGKQRKREVESWLKRVGNMSDKVCDINNGLRKSLFKHVHLGFGNRVEKALEEVASLQEQCKNFYELVMPNITTRLSRTEIVGETTLETIEKIWERLMDPQVGSIGIYGMGGVGKTIIMKNIYNRLIESPLFGDVIWVTMSKAVNLQMVQGEIANAIELDLCNDNNEVNRSGRISSMLMSMKRFVLILDEVWQAFSMDEIGIPELNSANGCKLLFATRDLGVCRILESQEEIKVDLLSEDEAWELFKNKIGGEEVSSLEVQVAKCVASECGRLPLAVVTVGRLLRKQSDARVWKKTLYQLTNMKKMKSIEDHLLLHLRSSYDRLRNEEIQDHFLYCALYPQDHAIPNMEIIEYWVWDGLIEEVDDKEVEINDGHGILNELKDACLLESGRSESNVEWVKMHNFIRRMALDITSTTQPCLVKAGVRLQQSPSEEELAEDVVRISLMGNNIKVLPHGYKCSKLSTLFLQNNESLTSISPSFFMHLYSLRVLNLSHTMIESLPDSIFALVNLHALLLGSCWKLNKLPPLRNLKKLRVLDISFTAIHELPQGLEELIKLRCLNLSHTMIESLPESMSALVNLQELILEKLDLREVPCSTVIYNGAIPRGTFANLRFLYIKECHHLNILFSLGLMQQLTKLEEVKVQDCHRIKEIVVKEEWVEADITNRNTRRRVIIPFPSLKVLTLVDLPELESIIGELVSCISLTYLVIKNCPKLKKLPFNDVSSNLEGEIKGRREWWDALEWDSFNDPCVTLLQSLFQEDGA